MKKENCLSEQNLILHYYGEISARSEQARHIAECPLCTERLAALSTDLAKLPNLSCKSDPAEGTRMAARVNERLSKSRNSWVAAFGVATAATLALVITVSTWSPQKPTTQMTASTSPLTMMNLNEEMPDINFLEDLELLKEFELLSQLEGV